ncbi:cytochrome c oxidase accessory protein CcoG [Pseudorhodoferax sp.]|uniref:cytochrome c oxidase accessory protein CcoG n=1 Tax=Pseudorhodoferax sp. TaxID=1993553 RepID=UPI002DD63163|nr:cytochrome c oxidase accessory protein CcoG [Pseudorhodoferax sp.]
MSEVPAQAPGKTAPQTPPPDADGSAQPVWLYEAHQKVYARSVSGYFARWRWALVWFTQILFYGLPWLMWNERQAMLFDLVSRRFYIFGLVLYPQDLIYLTALLMISAYGLFLFTAVAGRLWCGYACPQTVYTEIFMWIEQRFEGDRARRMRLDQGPWTFEKLWRKGGKQAAWIALGLWTGFTFVGYFTPIRELAQGVLAFSLGPWETFWVLFYGFATYGNAGFMREQVCKYMCPYARFQGAMFDKDTLIISYDTERGDPRGSRSRKADPKALGLGSCIDCTLCVQVCPTGIDIRNGLQSECIGCAACIDVCDDVMDKMNYPRGLIRYATENGMAQHLNRGQMWQRVLRPRVLIYTTVLLLICAAFVGSLALRSPFRVDVVRDRASLARIVEDGRVENVYRLQVMNSAEQPQRYRFSVEGLPGLAITEANELALGPAEARWVTLHVQLPHEAGRSAGPGAHAIRFHTERLPADGSRDAPVVLSEKSTFVVPR